MKVRPAGSKILKRHNRSMWHEWKDAYDAFCTRFYRAVRKGKATEGDFDRYFRG